MGSSTLPSTVKLPPLPSSALTSTPPPSSSSPEVSVLPSSSSRASTCQCPSKTRLSPSSAASEVSLMPSPEQVVAFEVDFLPFMKANHADILKTIAETEQIGDVEGKLAEIVPEFVASWKASQ